MVYVGNLNFEFCTFKQKQHFMKMNLWRENLL